MSVEVNTDKIKYISMVCNFIRIQGNIRAKRDDWILLDMTQLNHCGMSLTGQRVLENNPRSSAYQ